MTLLESLLDAITRLEGDALVMHVGEKPYVVTTSAAMNEYRGPLAWGQVELSSRVLTSDAVLGMVGQVLPAEQRQSLDELGAVEYELPAPEGAAAFFTVIAARGGDDVWLELRRKPKVEEPPAAAAEAVAPPQPEEEPVQAVAPVESASPVEFTATVDVSPAAGHETPAAPVEAPERPVEQPEEEAPFEIVPEVVQTSPSEADVNALLEASAAALLGSDVPSAAHASDALDLPLAVETSQPEPQFAAEPAAEVPVAEVPAADVPVAEVPIEQVPAPEIDIAYEEEVALDVQPEPVAQEVEAERQPETVIALTPEPEPVAPPEPEPATLGAPEPPPPPIAAPPPAPIAPPPAQVIEPEPQPIAAEPPPRFADAAPPPPATIAASAEELDREPRGVVVPIARPSTRKETADAVIQGFSVEEMLRAAAARGSLTVYVVAQSKPMVRAYGEISALDVGSGEPLTEADVNRFVLDVAPQAARDAWRRGASAEWSCDVQDVGRVRCMTFRDHRGPGVIFRMIPPRAISAEQLGLTPAVQALCNQSDGLVLVTGPRASGQSTLMSAFVDLINRTRGDHIITIESQIGFVHDSRHSFISQREVRGGGDAVVAAVRAALREDPDVLLVEDVRSAEVAGMLLEAAESGRLIFASLPAASTVAAIDRWLELFSPDRRAQAQTSLAGALRGVVAQVLLRRSLGGRVAVREVLLNTPPVARLIEEGETVQLPLAMAGGRRHGMMPLNDALAAFVRDGTVHVTEAYLKAFDKEGLLAALKRDGVDISFAERLA